MLSSTQPLVKLGVALPTPFTDPGAVNSSLMVSHAKNMLDAGCDTLVPFGTSGEGASLSPRIRIDVCQELVRQGIEANLLFPCIYGPSAQVAADEMCSAFDTGCRGVLLVPPFYFKGVDDEGLFAWYAQVINLAGPKALPTLAYNIPSCTGVTISNDLIAMLRQEFPEVLAGVKDSGGDWNHSASLIDEHKDLTILIGHEGYLAKAVQAGASGTISGGMNIAPGLISKLAKGEEDERIGELLEWLLLGPVIPNLKALLASGTGNSDWRRMAAPLQESSQEIPTAILEMLD